MRAGEALVRERVSVLSPEPSLLHARIQRGGGQGVRNPPEKIGFLSNSTQIPLRNHKANEPAFNVGSTSAL